MPQETLTTPEARRTGIRIGDPLLPATLELLYLRPVLDSLPPEWRTALDAGAGCGDVTAELLSRGLRVLAAEPDGSRADRLRRRFAPEARVRRFQLGSPARAVGSMLDAHGFREIGFARLDLDGPGDPAPAVMHSLLSRRGDPPAVICFGAGPADAGAAAACVRSLHARGYTTFDLFVRRGDDPPGNDPPGGDPVAAERFTGPGLPATWAACGGRAFRAAVIAWHAAGPADPRAVCPSRFVSDFQILRSADLLRAALRAEAAAGQASGPFAGVSRGSASRAELRSAVLAGGWAEFLAGRIGARLGARPALGHRPAPGHRSDDRGDGLASSDFGRHLFATIREPRVGAAGGVSSAGGAPDPVPPSGPLAGVLHDLLRLHEHADGRLPRSVVELSGGYGLTAWAWASVWPEVCYTIVDDPEALAVQHYFLTLSLPQVEVDFATGPEGPARPGSVRLVPLSLAGAVAPRGELLYCSKPLHRLPPAFAAALARPRGFGEHNSFFGGEWTFEADACDGPNAVAA